MRNWEGWYWNERKEKKRKEKKRKEKKKISNQTWLYTFEYTLLVTIGTIARQKRSFTCILGLSLMVSSFVMSYHLSYTGEGGEGEIKGKGR